MTFADRPRLAAALMVLGETFNEPVSKVRAEGYFDALSDLEIADVEQAVRAALRTQVFFPKPAELRALVEGSQADRVLLAWNDLVREVRRTGYTGRPSLPEATMDTIARVWGSWVALCETLPAEGPGLYAWEKRFRETYQAVATRDRLALSAQNPIGLFPVPAADGDT